MAEQENRPPVGGKEAGYLFEFREDGVYLTVFPEAADGVLFELSDIRQILQEHGVVDYDIVNLARMVREASGQPQKLTEGQFFLRSGYPIRAGIAEFDGYRRKRTFQSGKALLCVFRKHGSATPCSSISDRGRFPSGTQRQIISGCPQRRGSRLPCRPHPACSRRCRGRNPPARPRSCL